MALPFHCVKGQGMFLGMGMKEMQGARGMSNVLKIQSTPHNTHIRHREQFLKAVIKEPPTARRKLSVIMNHDALNHTVFDCCLGSC